MRLLVLCLLFAAALAEKVRYDGYQTLRLIPRDGDQKEFIHKIALEEKYDFWSTTDVMVPPRNLDDFKSFLTEHDINYTIMIDDVQTLLEAQTSEIKPEAVFNYGRYHQYDEIQQWVSDIASSYAIASAFEIAVSYEGRSINALKISTGGSNKRGVYWQGGIHAREWVSPATVMYITKQLLDDSNGAFAPFLAEFDFYIVPSLNVDGYSYTWTNDRMWRKTRSKNGGLCTGVDPNRNYDCQWGGEGASTSKCSDTYRGPQAHSESEVYDTTNFLTTSGVDFVSFIDFHSYSQLWLSPWSYSKLAPLPAADTDDQIAAGQAGCDALTAVHGTAYTNGPSARTLYAASGCSEDWGYDVLGAKYSYVIELRDEGQYGFALPESQIIPTGEETYAGMKAYLQYILDH